VFLIIFLHYLPWRTFSHLLHTASCPHFFVSGPISSLCFTFFCANIGVPFPNKFPSDPSSLPDPCFQAYCSHSLFPCVFICISLCTPFMFRLAVTQKGSFSLASEKARTFCVSFSRYATCPVCIAICLHLRNMCKTCCIISCSCFNSLAQSSTFWLFSCIHNTFLLFPGSKK
jgi:hypothetical protein